MERTYEEMFNEFNLLTDLELSLLFKQLHIDINVYELYNVFGNYCDEEYLVVSDIICFRFVAFSGVLGTINCNGNCLDVSWIE